MSALATYAHECPLCRKPFETESMGCQRGCPLVRHCGALCCPHCGYEFVDTTKTEARFARVGGWFATIGRVLRGRREEQG